MFTQIIKTQKEGKVVGFTASTFDLLHAGHTEMLAKAKAQCDYLVVGLLTDPTISRPEKKNGPIQSILERFIQLQSVSYIDQIIPFDTEEDLETMIKLINPDVRFVGDEYKGTKHTGWDLCPIIYNERKHNYGSSQLRDKIYKEESKKRLNTKTVYDDGK